MDEAEIQKIAEEGARVAAVLVEFQRATELMRKSISTNGPIVLQPEHCSAVIEMMQILAHRDKTDG